MTHRDKPIQKHWERVSDGEDNAYRCYDFLFKRFREHFAQQDESTSDAFDGSNSEIES